MAMDEQMGGWRRGAQRRRGEQIAAEGEQRLDIGALRRPDALRLLDHVVEAQLQPLVLAIGAERRGFGKAGVKDRQDMADPDIAEALQLIQATNGDVEGDESRRHVHGGPGLLKRRRACNITAGGWTGTGTSFARPSALP